MTTTGTALGELVDIHTLVPSPLNPRKSFDVEKLKELTASIESKGIIEPLIVRSRPGLGQLEIVAGERRYRAAKTAGLTELPVIIRTLSDVEVLELMAIENSQRDDLHPLEEADGYAALMKADRAYTPKAIAAKIGKSERYVQQRLSLGRLLPDVQKAFLAHHITAGHADLICRLQPDQQKAALKQCFHNLYGDDAERGCISVRALNRWIDENVRLQLTPDDPQTDLFPELAKAIETPEEAAKIIQVLGSYLPDAVLKEFPGALAYNAFKQVDGKKDRCPHTRRAVVIMGNSRGSFVEICAAKATCKKHFKWEIEERERQAAATTKTRPGTTATERAAKRKANDAMAARVLQEKRWSHAKTVALTQLKKITIKPSPAVLAVLQLSHFSAKSWTGLVVECLESDAFCNTPKDWTQLVALLKPFGIRLDAILKSVVDKETPQTSAKPGKKSKRAAA